jgi:hypothetical protein
VHEQHQEVLHEQNKEFIHEEFKAPVVTEKIEKTIVTKEVREPIIEKSVEKPVVIEELGTQKIEVCAQEGCNDVAHKHEERHGLGAKIAGVFSDIKHSITGEKTV